MRLKGLPPPATVHPAGKLGRRSLAAPRTTPRAPRPANRAPRPAPRVPRLANRASRTAPRGWLYSEDARSQRPSSHHRHLGPRAGEPRLLCRRPRHAAGQEERQPGRSRHLSPLLRRRRRASRHGPDVLSVGAAGAAAHRPRPGDRGRARGAARQPRLLGRAARAIRRRARAPSRRASATQVLPLVDPHGLQARAGRDDDRAAAVHTVGAGARFPESARSAASTARRSGSATRPPPRPS